MFSGGRSGLTQSRTTTYLVMHWKSYSFHKTAENHLEINDPDNLVSAKLTIPRYMYSASGQGKDIWQK